MKKSNQSLGKVQTIEKDKLQPYIGLALLIASAYFLGLLLRSYVWDMIFALLLYVSFYRTNRLIVVFLSKNKIKLPVQTIAAFLSTLLALSLIVVPLILLAKQLLFESYDLLSTVRLAIANGSLLQNLENITYFNWIITKTPFFWVELFNDLSNLSGSYGLYMNPQRVTNWSRDFLGLIGSGLQLTFAFLFHIVLIIASLFFLLRDASPLYKFIRLSIPLPARIVNHFTNRMYQITLDIVQGNIFIAVLQGIAIAIILAFLGFDNFISYGAIAALFSVVPIIGTSVVWVPSALYLAMFEMRLGAAVLLTVYCLTVLSILDNFVKPKLLNTKLGIHPLLLFFAIMGGIAELGLIGVIMGPLFLMLFKVIWDVYRI